MLCHFTCTLYGLRSGCAVCTHTRMPTSQSPVITYEVFRLSRKNFAASKTSNPTSSCHAQERIHRSGKQKNTHEQPCEICTKLFAHHACPSTLLKCIFKGAHVNRSIEAPQVNICQLLRICKNALVCNMPTSQLRLYKAHVFAHHSMRHAHSISAHM